MIVLDTSPAISLTAALGDLAIVPELFGTVVGPREVLLELRDGQGRDAAAEKLLGMTGFEFRPRSVRVPDWLARELDSGEAAVIQTALREGIADVLLDELRARRAARRAGLNVTGSLGVLLLAKENGLVSSVSVAIDRMLAHGAWLDSELIARALASAGE